jgi:hypothetical protein
MRRCSQRRNPSANNRRTVSYPWKFRVRPPRAARRSSVLARNSVLASCMAAGGGVPPPRRQGSRIVSGSVGAATKPAGGTFHISGPPLRELPGSMSTGAINNKFGEPLTQKSSIRFPLLRGGTASCTPGHPSRPACSRSGLVENIENNILKTNTLLGFPGPQPQTPGMPLVPLLLMCRIEPWVNNCEQSRRVPA